jgi:CheY-like chemotaxis protein
LLKIAIPSPPPLRSAAILAPINAAEGTAPTERSGSRERKVGPMGEHNRLPGVLVVDGEDANRSQLRGALAPEGYRVWDAANGEQAAAVLREHPDEIDIALISSHLSGATGLATAGTLRGIKPGLACCLVGGGVEAGLEPAPCERVLAKPYSVQDVVEVLRSLRPAGKPR